MATVDAFTALRRQYQAAGVITAVDINGTSYASNALPAGYALGAGAVIKSAPVGNQNSYDEVGGADIFAARPVAPTPSPSVAVAQKITAAPPIFAGSPTGTKTTPKGQLNFNPVTSPLQVYLPPNSISAPDASTPVAAAKVQQKTVFKGVSMGIIGAVVLAVLALLVLR